MRPTELQMCGMAAALMAFGCSGDKSGDSRDPQQSAPMLGAGTGSSGVAGTAALPNMPPGAAGRIGTSVPPTTIAGSAAPTPGNAPLPPVTPPASTPPGPGMMMTPPVTGGPMTAPPGPTPWNTSGKTCLQAGSGKFGEPGPYKVAQKDVDLGMIEANQSSSAFTIFYPNPLEASCLHPIVAWGNGTGVGDATTYAFFNSNAASWGMVVIAGHESNTGSGNFHKKGLDYLLMQNEDSSSPFYHKLSPRAATTGHSQGAFGATAGAKHPNVSVNIGVGGGSTTDAQHASMCLTGTEDIAATSCPGSVARAAGPIFAASWNGGDHVTTETVAGYIGRNAGTMAMQRLYAAWLRCYLADDGVACNLFKGATPNDCGLCKEMMDWASLGSKNIQ